MACKVFHRLALIIKMEHALNMCIFFHFTYSTILLTLFQSKPHIIIIFHLKTNKQKLEKHHVNGSQTRTARFCLWASTPTANSTTILVQVCDWNFSNPPYSCIRVFGKVYLFMYKSYDLLPINVCYELKYSINIFYCIIKSAMGSGHKFYQR